MGSAAQQPKLQTADLLEASTTTTVVAGPAAVIAWKRTGPRYSSQKQSSQNVYALPGAWSTSICCQAAMGIPLASSALERLWRKASASKLRQTNMEPVKNIAVYKRPPFRLHVSLAESIVHDKQKQRGCRTICCCCCSFFLWFGAST